MEVLRCSALLSLAYGGWRFRRLTETGGLVSTIDTDGRNSILQRCNLLGTHQLWDIGFRVVLLIMIAGKAVVGHDGLSCNLDAEIPSATKNNL